MKISKKCSHCNSKAIFYHNGKWWCDFKVKFGYYNFVGYCRQIKKEAV